MKNPHDCPAWAPTSQLTRVPEPPAPSAPAAQALLFIAVAALGWFWLMPLCLAPGVQSADVMGVWIGYGGIYFLAHLWTPRIIARVRRTLFR